MATSVATMRHLRMRCRAPVFRDRHAAQLIQTRSMISCSVAAAVNTTCCWRPLCRLVVCARSSPFERSLFGEDMMSEHLQILDRVRQQQESILDSMLQDMQRQEDQMHDMTSQMQHKIGRPKCIYSRKEQRNGFYRYESVTVWSSHRYSAPQVEPGISLALIAACAVAAVYTVVGAAFWNRYSATRFQDMAKWKLTVLWPFLFAFNVKFRTEFLKAVSGTAIPNSNSDDREDSHRVST